MVYVIQACRQLSSSSIRNCGSILILLEAALLILRKWEKCYFTYMQSSNLDTLSKM
jgi:hypothetical protein